MTQTTLVIPDIHDNIDKVAKILNLFPNVDSRIFLGDWFDSFKKPSAKETVYYLKTHIIDDPKNILLFGNHDIQYTRPCQAQLICSGFTLQKEYEINCVLFQEDWKKFRTHVWINNWLLSHAGFHAEKLNIPSGSPLSTKEYIDGALNHAEVMLHNGATHHLFRAGVSRGGSENYGGITWCDFREFEPIPGVNQIVGHTFDKNTTVRYKPGKYNQETSHNYCIDTGVHVALLTSEGNKTDVQIYEV